MQQADRKDNQTELTLTGIKAGEGNGTHSSVLAWKTPWTEQPGGLPSMGPRRVGHD